MFMWPSTGDVNFGYLFQVVSMRFLTEKLFFHFVISNLMGRYFVYSPVLKLLCTSFNIYS